MTSETVPVDPGETEYHAAVRLGFYSNPVVKPGLRPRASYSKSDALWSARQPPEGGWAAVWTSKISSNPAER